MNNINQETLKIGVASLRRSSVKQQDNNSFDVQKQAIKEFSKRKGYYIPDEFFFIDDAVSAYKTTVNKRKGMQMMKEVVLNEDVDGIFFYDFSRIDRKIYSFVTEFYYEVINEKPHLEFYTTTKEEKWSPKDLDVKFHLIISNAESSEKSHRAIDAQKKDLMQEEPKRPGATVPFGYNLIDKKLIKDDSNSSIIMFIFYLSSWGHSVHDIANLLNEAAIPSPNNGLWRGNTVDNILRNEVYLGQLKWKFKRKLNDVEDYVVEDIYQPLIPTTLFYLSKENRKLKQKYKKFNTPFILNDLLVCKGCGKTLKHRNKSTSKGSKKYSYKKYQCDTCNYNLDAESITSKVINELEKQLGVSFEINEPVIKMELENATDSLHKEKEMLLNKRKLVEINEEIARDKIGDNHLYIYRNTLQHINQKLDRLEKQIDKFNKLLTSKEISFLIQMFKGLNISRLKNTELRTIALYFIKEVGIDYVDENNCNLLIEFKTNPIAKLS